MLLKLVDSHHLVAVRDVNELVNPYARTVRARVQWGEEEQEPETFAKDELCFPSGELLPRCWLDEHYRDHELSRHAAPAHNKPVNGPARSGRPRAAGQGQRPRS